MGVSEELVVLGELLGFDEVGFALEELEGDVELVLVVRLLKLDVSHAANTIKDTIRDGINLAFLVNIEYPHVYKILTIYLNYISLSKYYLFLFLLISILILHFIELI
jgi:hypothetical protein